jgi:hypothetical protein
MKRRYCLWGGGESWVQIGSPADRRLQLTARAAANIERLGRAMGDMLLPAIERAMAPIAELARAIERSRTW